MKASLFVAAALLLATSAVVPTARADQQVPAPPPAYAPASAPSYAPPAARAAPVQQQASIPVWENSTMPAKIGAPKLP